jgi:hypothetical protein
MKTKITPKDLRILQSRATAMLAAGMMPPLEVVLAAIASTRTKFRPLILKARKEQGLLK